MDKNYSYDPNAGFLWSWDGDFHFEGVTREPPAGTLDFFGEKREFYEAAGALFLSGYRNGCAVIHYDNDELAAKLWFGEMKGLDSDMASYKWIQMLEFVSGKMKGTFPIILCGKVCSNSERVFQFCKALPSKIVYVCPVVDELASFGRLALEVPDKPRRAEMWLPNTDSLDLPFLEFDPKLDNDGIGRMAHMVCRGLAVHNDMRRGVGIPTFFGSVLHDGKCGETRFIVRLDVINKFFPSLPISAKNFAASNVFVSLSPNDKFRELSGVTSEKVDVVVATQRIPDLPVFMNFYKAMSNMDFVGISDPKDVKFMKSIPLFRYNRVYKVSPEEKDAFQTV